MNRIDRILEWDSFLILKVFDLFNTWREELFIWNHVSDILIHILTRQIKTVNSSM